MNSTDVNAVQSATLPNGSTPDNAAIYKYDFDNNGFVASADVNLIRSHITGGVGVHNCKTPLNP